MLASRKKILAAIVGMAFFVIIPVSAGASFTRTLKHGDSGSDVLGLQTMLNRDLLTRVAVTGPGSPGFESSYFGRLTAAAVVRFQEKYRAEVLVPAGLSRGTGVVGPLTRAKLNALSAIVAPPQAGFQPAPVVPSTPAGVEAQLDLTPTSPAPGGPTLSAISPASGGPGTVLTITGAGFEAVGNTVYAGYTEFVNVPSQDGKTLRVTIDAGFKKFVKGPVEFPFWIYVKNTLGSSEALVFTYQSP